MVWHPSADFEGSSYANRFMNQPPFVIPHSHPLPPKLVTFSEEEGLIQKYGSRYFLPNAATATNMSAG